MLNSIQQQLLNNLRTKHERSVITGGTCRAGGHRLSMPNRPLNLFVFGPTAYTLGPGKGRHDEVLTRGRGAMRRGGAERVVQVKGACEVPTACAPVRVCWAQVLCSGAGADAVQVPGSGPQGEGVGADYPSPSLRGVRDRP